MRNPHVDELYSLSALLDIPKEIGWRWNAVLWEFRVTERADGWLVMLKAKRRGQFRVAFMGGSTFSGALENCARELRRGTVTWKQDSYVPDRLLEE